MTTPILNAAQFQNEEAAFAYVEAALWPEGPVCPHCGGFERISKMQGKSTRVGLYKCYQCRKPFTVRMKTIFEVLAHCAASVVASDPPALRVEKRNFEQSASPHPWDNPQERVVPLASHPRGHARWLSRAHGRRWWDCRSGGGGTVEVDETLVGKIEGAPKNPPRGRSAFRNVVLTVVERGGSARSFHVDGTTIGALKPIIHANIAREASMMTDQAGWYSEIGKAFASHDTVNHAKDEYARYEGAKVITTNTVEGYYSIFKRGMKGMYRHCGERHLHRYLAEFDFRYSNRVKLGVDDTERANRALLGVKGKRLTYQTARN